MTDKLEVSRDMAASPDAVYAAISDVTRMGDWSDECRTCEWHEGFDGPEVGATFDGHNRNGDKSWTTQGKVVEADPGRAFTFECSVGDVHYSTWGYRIQPTDGGCRTVASRLSHPGSVSPDDGPPCRQNPTQRVRWP